MLTHNLGFPRIGANRELKTANEQYWAGKITEEELKNAGRLERLKNWKFQSQYGMDLIPCNDFSFYDHVQDVSFMVGALPERYTPLKGNLSDLDLYFAMCRGYQKGHHDVIAMEMTKWFDTNYHYLVPEFDRDQTFFLHNTKVIDEYVEARRAGFSNIKPVMLGPVSYLLLGKEKQPGFCRLDLINNLTQVYYEIFEQLCNEGCEIIQLDEPFLATDLLPELYSVYQHVYRIFRQKFPRLKVMLATYFGGLGANLEFVLNLPVDVIHIDFVKGNDDINLVLNLLPEDKDLSLGIIDGRNIWKNNFQHSLDIINKAKSHIGDQRLLIAPSCSLLHVPYDLDQEKNIPSEIKRWMAFGNQKIIELEILKDLSSGNPSLKATGKLILNEQDIIARKTSPKVHNGEVKERVDTLKNKSFKRKSNFELRKRVQQEKLNLPVFPTTTIGSFPQTKEIRKKRNAFKKKLLNEKEYLDFIKKEIKESIQWQEEIGLDVLVHGEFERNDMVEFFGEQLEGFVFTENGWVQSYGSRGVKPPIIYGDVWRSKPMTVDLAGYAQSIAKKYVKGMLTGPVTILQWSFVRDDQAREMTACQIALALKEEVMDLERAGIEIIQIDEPALREGLPLKQNEWKDYLKWATKAFRICCSEVKDSTQIHTHMCYAEFNDIIEAIASMDADVITIETSRSQMELLEIFETYKYPNQIGPGVYDIHSPRIPTVDEMKKLLERALRYISYSNLWVNPDCGLKTRNWEEVRPALRNMVEAAVSLRNKVLYTV